MATLFDKARTFFLSTAHSLLDAAIDLDSVGAVKQYVRDLEASLADLESSSAEGKGYVRTLTREIKEAGERAKKLDSEINLILSDDNPHNDTVAEAKQVELDAVEEVVTTKTEELEAAKMTADKLSGAVTALRAKHASMVQRIQQLESMQRSTKAKEGAAKAMKLAGDLVASGESVSVDNVVKRMRQQSDVADVKFEEAMGTFKDKSGQDAAFTVAQAKIAERKKKLAAAQSQTAAAPA